MLAFIVSLTNIVRIVCLPYNSLFPCARGWIGIKSLELDEEKCTLTVVGTADVVDIVKELKKVKKAADVVSVGDNKNKKKEEEKCKELALCCAACRTMGFGSFRSFPSKLVYVEEPSSGCTII